MNIYDYIYVDREKIISLYSQLTGGVVEVIERSTENSRSADNKRNYDFKIFKHDAGGTQTDKGGLKETIKPHHALLKELEDSLAANGYLVNLAEYELSKSLRDPVFRGQLKDAFCIKVRGRAVIEDYERLKGIAGSFPEIVELINKGAESAFLKSPDYIALQEQLKSAENNAKDIKDRSQRIGEQQKIKLLRDEVSNRIKSLTKIQTVEQWILDGLKTWVDVFLPGIINFRVYPSADRPDEHVFGHLKKHCFEDPDTSSFHFTYGSFPTEDLTMIGIITSVPFEEGEQFKPLAEFEKDDLADYESIEKGFRGVFRGFDGFEQMVRTCRFPRILVHPLTIYRSVSPNPSLKRTLPN